MLQMCGDHNQTIKIIKFIVLKSCLTGARIGLRVLENDYSLDV